MKNENILSMFIAVSMLFIFVAPANAVILTDSDLRISCSELGGTWSAFNTCTVNNGVNLNSDLTIPHGYTLTITGSLNLYGDLNGNLLLTNKGVINIPGTLYLSYTTLKNEGSEINNNAGTIYIDKGGMIENTGGLISISGTIHSYGGIVNKGGTIENIGTIYNHAGEYGWIGSIQNSGTIDNYGTIINDIFTVDSEGGNLYNDGIINNYYNDPNKPGTIINNAGTIIDNDGFINNYGTIKNEGLINNHGTINNSGIIDNVGTINNQGTFRNFASIINIAGTIDNFVLFINEVTGTIINGSPHTINNYGTWNNNGIINNEGGTINNEGGLTNTGTIEGTGTIDNSGTINNCGGTIVGFQGTCQETQIPEFPTIVLPVASVIGLMILIGRRKKQE